MINKCYVTHVNRDKTKLLYNTLRILHWKNPQTNKHENVKTNNWTLKVWKRMTNWLDVASLLFGCYHIEFKHNEKCYLQYNVSNYRFTIHFICLILVFAKRTGEAVWLCFIWPLIAHAAKSWEQRPVVDPRAFCTWLLSLHANGSLFSP